MKKLMAAGALALAVAAVAAGCGGDSNKGYALSKSEYAAALNEICTDVNEQVDEKTGGSDDLKEALQKSGDDVVGIGREFVKRIRALTPPDELKDAAGNFADTTEEGIDKLEEAVEAAKDDDDARITSATTELEALDDKADGYAGELGANVCVTS